MENLYKMTGYTQQFYWKQLKCPSVRDGISKLYIYVIKYTLHQKEKLMTQQHG